MTAFPDPGCDDVDMLPRVDCPSLPFFFSIFHLFTASFVSWTVLCHFLPVPCDRLSWPCVCWCQCAAEGQLSFSSLFVCLFYLAFISSLFRHCELAGFMSLSNSPPATVSPGGNALPTVHSHQYVPCIIFFCFSTFRIIIICGVDGFMPPSSSTVPV